MVFHILVADKLAKEGVELLKKRPEFAVDERIGLSPDALKEAIGAYHGILIRSQTQITADLFPHATNLKMIGRAGIGVDNVDLSAAFEHGVVVMNTPDGNAITTAEHAIALLMALARHIPAANQSLKAGSWEKSRFNGTEIYGKLLGIVGLGKIGRLVAARAKGLQMEVQAFDPFVDQKAADEAGVRMVSFDALMQTSDFLSVHAQLNEHTYHLINEEALSKAKPGLMLVHAARGGIVCEEALLGALESGRIKGAALDVFESEPPRANHPLIMHPNVVATPHLGASTLEAQHRVGIEIAEIARDFFLHNQRRNVVRA